MACVPIFMVCWLRSRQYSLEYCNMGVMKWWTMPGYRERVRKWWSRGKFQKKRKTISGYWWGLWESTAGRITMERGRPFPSGFLISKRLRRRKSLFAPIATNFSLTVWRWGWSALTILNPCARNAKPNVTTAIIKRRSERWWSFLECIWSNTAGWICCITTWDDDAETRRWGDEERRRKRDGEKGHARGTARDIVFDLSQGNLFGIGLNFNLEWSRNNDWKDWENRDKKGCLFCLSKDRGSGSFTSLPEGRTRSLGMHPVPAHVNSRWLIKKRRREVRLWKRKLKRLWN